MVMHNQILEKILSENQQLKRIYLKDKMNLLYFIFLFYSINKDKSFENISLSNFKKKIDLKINSNYAYKTSWYNLAFNGILDITFKESYEYLFKFDKSELKELLTYICNDYLTSSLNQEYSFERIEKVYFNEDLGDFLILSNIPKLYLFNKTTKFNSITFNFYDEIYNDVASIYFDIYDIKYSLFDLKKILNDEDISFDSIYYCLPYKKQDILLNIQNIYKDKKGSLELASLKDLHNHLKPNGHLVVLLPTGILNNIRDFKSKQYFVDNGYVNLVLELPRLPFTQILLSMIFISRENKKILMSNASKYAVTVRKDKNVNIDKIIRVLTGDVEDALVEMDLNYIKENKYDLTPHRYTDKKHFDFLNRTTLDKVTLEMFRGYQIPSSMIEEYESELPTNIKLLTLTDIDNGEIIEDSLLSLKSVDKKMQHYILKNNDLIISCKGKSFKTCVVEIPRNKTYISTGSIIVIRLNLDVIDPMYLKIFLDSNIGNNALKNIQTGSSVLSLNPTKLLNIEIPLVDIMKQQQIASSYRYKLQNIKEVKEVMDSMKNDLDKKFDDDFLNLLQ